MKLFTKIFLQIFVSFLLLSQVIFIYIVNQSKEQMITSIENYESSIFWELSRKFENKFQEFNFQQEEENIQKLMAVSSFRAAFGSNGVLYRNQEELFNSTPYEFDVKAITEEMRGTGKGEDSRGIGRVVDSRSFLILPCGDKSLLVFLSTGDRRQASDTYQLLYYKDVTDIFVRSKKLLLDGLGFTLLALLVIGGILFRGIYRTIRPLVELKKAAASIASGAYEIRLPIRGKDEISELSASFNQMAEKVEEHVEKLSATNEAQRRLLGSLAHELKTPMTAIIGYADTLLTVRLSDRRREQALNYIGNECRRLSRLSVKMLELTGLYETGESSLEQKEEQIEELLKRLKDLTAYRLREKQVCLEIHCEPEELTHSMDSDLMMSLLMNLVDNAYKASGEGGIIRVRADETGFLVEDFGKGIPEEEVERVAEAFYMVDKSRSRSAGSVGLGLAICKQIADMHGAELRIESEEGKGTRVSVLWK